MGEGAGRITEASYIALSPPGGKPLHAAAGSRRLRRPWVTTMRPPPPLAALPRFPLTGGVAILAIMATLADWQGIDAVSRLAMGPRWWIDQPWALLTSALPHLGFFHLAFNIYWLWVFGTLIESELGGLKTAGLMGLLAAGSAAAEHAFLHGGVGLSGVGYGLFGFLWVVHRRDRRFYDAIDPQTTGIFVIWFFLCIVLTATEVLRVANVAHAAGALLGGLMGYAALGRRAAAVGAGAAVLGLLLLDIVGRPYVNVSPDRPPPESAHDGYEALLRQDDEEAVRLYREAVTADPGNSSNWFNLGVALHRCNRPAEALDAYRCALRLGKDDGPTRSVIAALENSLLFPASRPAVAPPE